MPSLVQAIDSLENKSKVESFLESELYINITEHDLVPRHIVMTEKEKQELLDRWDGEIFSFFSLQATNS